VENTTRTVSISDVVVRPHHTCLSAADFEATRDFFVNIIGMRVEAEMDHRREDNFGAIVGLDDPLVRWAMLELGGYRLELFKYYAPEGRKLEMRQCDLGLTHLCFEVYDVELVYERLTRAGYRTFSRPLELRAGRSKPVYVIGPEGVIIEFLELRPWR
jgi:glyoxylase I family protein